MKISLDASGELQIDEICIVLSTLNFNSRFTEVGLTRWSRYTRNELGTLSKYANSTGFWCVYKRDEDGNILSYESSDNQW